MGSKYFITARLSGLCEIIQEGKHCKTFIGLIIALIMFRLKYPIVDLEIRNGYKYCDTCKYISKFGNPFCYCEKKGEDNDRS